MSDYETTSTYDPELAILRELEAELERELALLERPRLRARSRDRRALRITRRALVLLVLVSLVGASALAGRSVLSGSHNTSTPPTMLASGGRGAESWQLDAYVYHGATCYALFLDQTATSACKIVLESGSVAAVSAAGPTQRLVAGLAGAEVAAVRVRAGDRVTLTETHAQPGGARRAELAAGLRWFVAVLPGKADAADLPPASIAPQTRDGRALGPAVLDCSLGADSQECRRLANGLAAGRASAPY